MAWRLALDMGTNSLGWAAFKLDTEGRVTNLLDSGVRIFPDGREPSSKSRVGESLAVERRLARGTRRNRDRRNNRKRQLLEKLIQLGLMPANQDERHKVEGSSPYKLRSEGVERPLSAIELGRVIMHLSQRRGFLSNRKSDGDDENGHIRPRISALKIELGDQTLGQWLYKREVSGKSLRFRATDEDFWPDRSMYLAEFDRLRETQQPHHHLSDDDWNLIRDGSKEEKFDGLYFQRPLKPVERGRCQYFVNEYRAHKDLPISHEFRILQEVANLVWYDKKHSKHQLDEEQYNRLVEELNKQKSMSFGGMRKLKRIDGSLLFPKESRFNLEESRTGKLKGNETACTMRNPNMLGTKWDKLSPHQQNGLMELLHDALDVDQLTHDLIHRFDFDRDEAEGLLSFKLVSATTNLSRKFMERCAAVMAARRIGYVEATAEVYDDDGVFLHHSNRSTSDQALLDRLPYYGSLLKGSVIGGKPHKFSERENPEGHFGKINNPTVHVALNQLRRLVNCLIERFGPPEEVHVELVRDLKKTAKVRNEIASKNKKFAKENIRRAGSYKEITNGHEPSALDLKKMRLWEELEAEGEFGRKCPFSGKVISAAMLFNGGAEVEHILPFSKTLDNSTANLTIATCQANRLKGNNTPFEAFANNQHADKGMVWLEIADRAKSLPANKRWRFDADAMERYQQDGGFIARQLTDNAYISKVTKRYLSYICPNRKIMTVPGRLTAMMRGKWHLNNLVGDHNYKERHDQRHHAIDAFVVGLTDRATLNHVSENSKRGADDLLHIELPDISNLRNQLKARLDRMVISYKADHGTNGKMFKETAYGIVPIDQQDPDLKGYDRVTRMKLSGLTEKQIDAIRNSGWRKLIQKHVYDARATGVKLDKKGLEKVLDDFSQEHGIKKVRVLVPNQSSIIIEHDSHGKTHQKAYAPDSYVCVDIWQEPKGKPGKWKSGEYIWKGAFWSYADCTNENTDDRDQPIKEYMIRNGTIHPAAKFITRLFKNDMIEIMNGNQPEIMRVGGYSTTQNKVDLRPQYSSGGGQSFISINILKNQFVRKLYVLPDGSIRG